MKRRHFWLFSLIMLMFCTLQADQIQWTTNFETAQKQAKSQNLPILLFFTGSDWCGWCQKFENESLDTPEFASLAKNKFIFVKLDFPSKTKLSAEETAQNKELQQRYGVRGFPTIVILSPELKQIGVTGYRPGGGREYANHLLKIVQDYGGYKQGVSTLQEKQGKELVELHEKAKEFFDSENAEVIAMAGTDSDEASYFMLERLRMLAARGQGDSQEANKLREKLLKTNSDHIHYHLAVLDFQARYQEMREGKRDVGSTLAPLFTYIEKYGNQDQENIWRLQMIISQVYSGQEHFKEALQYAKQSYQNAPSENKPDIAAAIQEISSQ